MRRTEGNTQFFAEIPHGKIAQTSIIPNRLILPAVVTHKGGYLISKFAVRQF